MSGVVAGWRPVRLRSGNGRLPVPFKERVDRLRHQCLRRLAGLDAEDLELLMRGRVDVEGDSAPAASALGHDGDLERGARYAMRACQRAGVLAYPLDRDLLVSNRLSRLAEQRLPVVSMGMRLLSLGDAAVACR